MVFIGELSLKDVTEKVKKYQVRFYAYQYNSGAADNRLVYCNKIFDDLKEAEKYARKIKRILDYRNKDKDNCGEFPYIDRKYYSRGNHKDKLEEMILDEFLSYSGFIKSYDGIYEVMKEEKI